MRTWNLGTGRDGSAVADIAIHLIDDVGRDGFDRTLLDAVRGRLDADSLTAYRLSTSAPPARYCAASREKADSTASCWEAYRDGIYRADETFDEAHERASGTDLVIGHLTAEEVRYRPHRTCIYDRHQLLDRLSVSGREPNGDLLALNLYRHRDLGHFDDIAIGRFEDVAAVLMAAVRRHAALAAPPLRAPDDDVTAGPRIARYDRMLTRYQPTLTVRERAVCARLLTGMLYDGIAKDLGIGVATVKTYRQRAFERLGIHFRSELLGIALEAQKRADD